MDCDALGQWIRQGTSLWTNNAWQVIENLKLLSDPMLYGRHIVELNYTNNALARSDVWGLDLSETLDGAGGVGGLLWVNQHTGSSAGAHFCAYDGNGNVVALVSANTGTETARYEYGPFAEPIRVTGPMSKENPFRFSTKRTCNITDLVLYEYRAYSPSLGRWATSDPINEIGSKLLHRRRHHFNRDEAKNLNGFVRNNAVNYVDYRGESATAGVLGWIGTDCAVPEPSDAVWVKWAAYGVLLCVAVAIDACLPTTCPLINEIDQEEIGEPFDLDGYYQPAIQICVYRCPKVGVIRRHFPPGTKCAKSIIEPKV